MRITFIFVLLLLCVFNSIGQTAKERSVTVSASIVENPARIDFSWDADPKATQYKVYKKSLDSMDWGNPIAILDGNSSSFSDTSIQIGIGHEYGFYKKEYELVRDTFCVPANTPIQFNIKDMYGKGLCCNFGFGYYQVQACGEEVAKGDKFFWEANHEFSVCSSSKTCEDIVISIAPDMFPNGTNWTLTNSETNELLGSSGDVGTFIDERPAYGFIYAGIKIPPIEARGAILLLIEDDYVDSLLEEINQLKFDLIGDGWTVHQITANSEESVVDVKAKIQKKYQEVPNLHSLYIIGHVPVPYSGDIYPDTHAENHWGAWSADTYYGDLDGIWTDTSVNLSVAFFDRNKNIPGDGKFDQDSIPSKMELQVGRIDFFNMLAFSANEIELTRQYLNKAHLFKTGQIDVQRRALIDDNFKHQFAAPAASGWRNFAAMFGVDQIEEKDYFSTMLHESYLWSYGCGSGSHVSSEGIGTTNDFANNNLQCVFTMLFGSQFGDWDNDNNFLKAPLASGLTLTNVWAGSPPWTFHHMAMGYPIGYSAIQSQNSNNFIYLNGPQLVHTALMGDPSLRMHPVEMPKDLLIMQLVNESNQLTLAWTAPADSTIIGYHIYRSAAQNGNYERLTNEPITVQEYTDRNPMNGQNHYLVRSVKLEQSGSGTYYNMSLGLMGNIDFTTSTKEAIFSDLKIYPNPSTGQINIRLDGFTEHVLAIKIYNRLGQLNFEKHFENIGTTWRTHLEIKEFDSGVYIVKFKTKTREFVQKIVLIK